MIASGVVVYVSCQPVDFRKGAASLMALVRDGGLAPFSGALHVFRSKRADRVRIVWWDGSGVCLYSKTLEDHSFCWPGISAARMRLDHAQLMALLAGLDWKRFVRPGSGGRYRRAETGLRQDESCGWNGWESGCFCALLLAMVLPGLALPDDVDALKAMILSMAREQAASEARIAVADARIAASEAEVARLKAVEKSASERIANLTSILKVLQRTQHGTRSERLRLAIDDEQASFAFEEVETGLSEIRSELDRAVGNKPKRAPRPRKGFAAHLERIEEVVEPEIPADCEGLEKVLIGEDRSERLDVVPPKFQVIVTRRPKYAFRGRDGVVQALAPAHIIESGLPTERLLAYIAVSKYADGLPLYRQEAIYLRDGVEISRSLMAQWMGHLGFELQMLADYILERIKEGERVFADETTLPTLAPGSGKTTKAWLWAYARDDRPYGGTSPPMVAYRFEDSRGADCVARHLAGFSGILQVDGYSAYTNLVKARAKAGSNETIRLAGCWAHLRRKFYDLHISGVSQAATDSIIAMTELWKVEDEVRGKDAGSRAALRQEKSVAIVASLFDLWEAELGKVSGKSKTAEAIRYALTRREALERFLMDGRIEIDANIVERVIRPQTITRKNSLFAGSHGGGRTWATVATLLQTCKMNSVDPLDWLSQTLTRIAQGWPASEIEMLMPWNFRPDVIG